MAYRVLIVNIWRGYFSFSMHIVIQFSFQHMTRFSFSMMLLLHFRPDNPIILRCTPFEPIEIVLHFSFHLMRFTMLAAFHLTRFSFRLDLVMVFFHFLVFHFTRFIKHITRFSFRLVLLVNLQHHIRATHITRFSFRPMLLVDFRACASSAHRHYSF